jgi:hypothetical protein
MSPDPLGGNIGDPQSLNRYAYVRNNPLSFTDPTGMFDQGGGCEEDGTCGCDPNFCGGIDIGFGGWSFPSPSPIYDSPDVGADPNTTAGDPDPDGPFSGPIWQEGGPQIPTTGNLYQILGLPNPPMLIFDANGSELDTSGINSPAVAGQCLADFYRSPIGEATKFGSPLQMVPGWGPNWLGSVWEWTGLGSLKYVFGKATLGSTTNTVYSVTAGSEGTVSTSSYLGAKFASWLPWAKVASAVGLGAATLMDINMHAACYGTNTSILVP